MGTSPCKRGPVRLTAFVLLAVQTSIVAVASAATAGAESRATSAGAASVAAGAKAPAQARKQTTRPVRAARVPRTARLRVANPLPEGGEAGTPQRDVNVRDYRIERLHRVFEDRAPDIAPFDSGLPGAELPGAELPDTELLNTAPSDTGMAVLAGIAALGKATETVRRPVGEGVENVENVENLEGVEGVSNVGGVHARRVQAHRESRTWRHRAFRPVVREARERVLTYAPAAKRVAADRLTRARAQAAVRMGHRQAVGRLLRAGLKWKSSGGCSDRHVHTCTSLDSVRTGTVDKVIALKRASRCPIMITGGTETGHAPGTYSHANGYKLDITANRCVTRYITRTFEPHGTRGDGAALYKSPGGDIYAHESDHWDIQFM